MQDRTDARYSYYPGWWKWLLERIIPGFTQYWNIPGFSEWPPVQKTGTCSAPDYIFTLKQKQVLLRQNGPYKSYLLVAQTA